MVAAHVAQRLASHAHVLTDLDPLGGMLHSINQELYEIARRDPDCTGTGACVAGLAVTAHQVLWFDVGDVRIYRENGGYLGQSSVDDSPAPPQTDPDRPAHKSGLVLQSLGGATAPTPIDPHLGAEAAGQPGLWLLCSDGLSDLVKVTAMEKILTEARDDTRVVKELWAAVMNASGRDNITPSRSSASRLQPSRRKQHIVVQPEGSFRSTHPKDPEDHQHGPEPLNPPKLPSRVARPCGDETPAKVLLVA